VKAGNSLCFFPRCSKDYGLAGQLISDFRLQIDDCFRRVARGTFVAIEIAILMVLLLATRWANYQEVLSAGISISPTPTVMPG
jgi:hypothetical protein